MDLLSIDLDHYKYHLAHLEQQLHGVQFTEESAAVLFVMAVLAANALLYYKIKNDPPLAFNPNQDDEGPGGVPFALYYDGLPTGPRAPKAPRERVLH